MQKLTFFGSGKPRNALEDSHHNRFADVRIAPNTGGQTLEAPKSTPAQPILDPGSGGTVALVREPRLQANQLAWCVVPNLTKACPVAGRSPTGPAVALSPCDPAGKLIESGDPTPAHLISIEPLQPTCKGDPGPPPRPALPPFRDPAEDMWWLRGPTGQAESAPPAG